MDENKDKTRKKKVYNFNIRVTAPIYNAVRNTLDMGIYLNISEYINDLFRQHFKEKGIELGVTKVSSEDKEEAPSMEFPIDTVIVHARLPIPMRNAIGKVLDTGNYFNISHYIRDVVKKDLDARGIDL